MGGRIIDSCSILNLYAGWGGLDELRPLNQEWYVCEAALGEAEFTREFGPDGNLADVPLDLSPFLKWGLLRLARPETDVEMADYVDFAQEIDDGEAQALAIAKHRNYTLLTDDRKATRIAARADVAVRTITTVHVLREWQDLTKAGQGRLIEVIQRIEVLARFAPPKNSADFQWWLNALGRGT